MCGKVYTIILLPLLYSSFIVVDHSIAYIAVISLVMKKVHMLMSRYKKVHVLASKGCIFLNLSSLFVPCLVYFRVKGRVHTYRSQKN